MRRLRDVLLCAASCGLFLCLIVALDVVTGVPLSYGVPLAALLALAPYAFVMARGLTARHAYGARRAATTAGAAAAAASAQRRAGREDEDEDEDLAVDHRPCAIHSVIFLDPDSGRARAGHTA